MKLNGIFGTGSGKTGNAVFATSAGKQIVRTYQPKVANPNTEAQVAQRAKFKLISQLAAALAPVIMIPKKGLTSARNRFVQINLPFAGYQNGMANVAVTAIQLTDSVKPLGELSVTLNDETHTLNVEFINNLVGVADKVKYVVCRATKDDRLQIVSSKTIDIDTNDNPNGEASFTEMNEAEYVVFAYGLIAKIGGSNAGYNNYTYAAGDANAELDTAVSESLRNYDVTHTIAALTNV